MFDSAFAFDREKMAEMKLKGVKWVKKNVRGVFDDWYVCFQTILNSNFRQPK